MAHGIHQLLTGEVRAAAGALIRETSNQLFLTYTGRGQALMADPILFFGRAGLLERNIVIVRDRRSAYYQRGISSDIDSFEKFCDWQLEVIRSLSHVQRLFCLGTSMGGYAAILFGHLFKAEEVWAFGPQTLIDPDLLDDTGALPPERLDLARLLSVSNGRTKYNVYYNQAYEPDVIAARRIAGAPGVHLWPQGGEGHAVVKVLMETASLQSLAPEPT